MKALWNRRTLQTRDAQRETYEPFRCTECREVAWFVVVARMRQPEHCGQVMAMLDGHAAGRLREKQRGPVVDEAVDTEAGT